MIYIYVTGMENIVENNLFLKCSGHVITLQSILQLFLLRGSIIAWRSGGFGFILNAEYGCYKKISAVYGFCIARQLRKIGI